MAKAEDAVEEKQEKKTEGQAEQKSADKAARKKRGRKISPRAWFIFIRPLITRLLRLRITRAT